MKFRVVIGRIAVGVTMALLVTGCGGTLHSENVEKKPKMNADQAQEGMSAVLSKTFSAIRPTLKYQDASPTVSRSDDIAGRPTGTATLSRYRYVMTKVSAGKRGALLGVVERSWKKFGYSIGSVNPDKEMPSIAAATPDGYGIQIEVGYPGNVSFVATSPVIDYPEGSNQFSGGGMVQNIMPNVDDAFWSH
ncbi:hypothetical protein ACWGCW_07235 [Streptomyces sp. NPDC054933]